MAQVSTDKFVASMLRSNYYDFFRHFWHLTAAEPLNVTWYIREVCNQLQHLAERVFANQPKEYDFVYNCPPGTSKSTMVSILWQPWVWTRMPSARFISGSHSERLSLDHSRKSRDVVTSQEYQTLFPEIQLREDQSTKSYWVNTHGGMRYATGVGGSVIGQHAHFITIDDPIDPIGALSDLVLDEANTWMTETLSRRKVNLLLTPTVLIMQRLHQNDPTGVMLPRENVLHWCLPGDDSWEVKPESFKQYYTHDGLLDPNRVARKALHQALDELGEAGYSAQYGQQPVPRGGSQFKVDRLLYQATPPTLWKRGPVRFWDKAASLDRRAAFTAGVKLALDHADRVWVLDVIRGRWDSGTREKIILDAARADGKKCKVGVEQEPGSGGKESAESTIRRLILNGFRAVAFPSTAAKELRADPFSEYVNMGSVIILNAPWNETLVQEMQFFPVSTYKDQVDAASGGFAMLVKKRTRIGALG